MYDLLKVKTDEWGVAEVTLSRPEIHNAFNSKLVSELTKVFKELDEDDKIRLIVLTGDGKSFCAGADLTWMSSMVEYSELENLEDSKDLFDMFDTINNCSKPVIGKINGHALGGGVGLVAVCDYAITTERAKFGFTEVRLGLVPAVISSFCISKIGEANARAWFLSGERFDAKQAMLMGLVHEVVDEHHFEKRTEEVVESYLMAGPEASKAAKKLIKDLRKLKKDSLKIHVCSEIALRRVSEEGQEGMKALLEKRKAKWIKDD